MAEIDLSILNKPADSIKPPVALPAGLYKVRVTKHEFGANEKTGNPYVRYTCRIIAYGKDVDPEDLTGIEWQNRMLRKDFWLTDDSLFILTKFLLETLHLNGADRPTRDLIPEAENSEVWAVVKRAPGQDERVYNNIERFIVLDEE